MALNVKFLKGTKAQYDASAKTSTTFYLVDDTDLYLGEIKLSNAADLTAAIARISTNEQDIAKIKQDLSALTGGEGGSISDMIDKAVDDAKTELEAKITANTNAIDAINNTTTGILATAKKYADDQDTAKIGDLGTLDTTAKGTVVSAINEVVGKITDVNTDLAVTIDTTTTTPGMSKSYTLKQGTTNIGVIDVPKDMVVSSGTVEVDPAGQAAGTYLVLTLANATSDKVYINVGTLVDIYTAQASAAQIQLAINSTTREISATVVAESIGTAELAAKSVTTAKIADGNVTLVKLAKEVTDKLDAADSALQAADITTGTANGTIAVDGTDVAVKGLGGAAYKEVNAFDAAGSATTAETNAKTYTDNALTWNTIA